METLLFALISLAMRWLEPRHNAQLQFLREQIRILQSMVDAERIVPTPAECPELLRIQGQKHSQKGALECFRRAAAGKLT